MYVKLNQPYSVARSAAVFQIRGKDSERWNAGTRTVLHCYYYAVLASLIALYDDRCATVAATTSDSSSRLRRTIAQFISSAKVSISNDFAYFSIL